MKPAPPVTSTFTAGTTRCGSSRRRRAPRRFRHRPAPRRKRPPAARPPVLEQTGSAASCPSPDIYTRSRVLPLICGPRRNEVEHFGTTIVMTDITINSTDRHLRKLHPLGLRIMHWVNAVAMIIMIGSGWEIYNDEVIFGW